MYYMVILCLGVGMVFSGVETLSIGLVLLRSVLASSLVLLWYHIMKLGFLGLLGVLLKKLKLCLNLPELKSNKGIEFYVIGNL